MPNCQRCGKELNRKGAKWCSDKCRIAYKRAKLNGIVNKKPIHWTLILWLSGIVLCIGASIIEFTSHNQAELFTLLGIAFVLCTPYFVDLTLDYIIELKEKGIL